MGQGGEVFVLDMGEPVKIADLARKMMHLMGRRERTAEQPDGEIERVFSGLRPGEKLFEELLIGDDPQGTAHPRIMMAREVCMTWPEVEDTVKQLQHASQVSDCEEVLSILKTAPNGGVGDLVWNLNPRPVVARATDKVWTDFKPLQKARKIHGQALYLVFLFPPTAHNSALCHRLANTPVPSFHLVCRGPKALERR